jgi:hypothetical protein
MVEQSDGASDRGKLLEEQEENVHVGKNVLVSNASKHELERAHGETVSAGEHRVPKKRLGKACRRRHRLGSIDLLNRGRGAIFIWRRLVQRLLIALENGQQDRVSVPIIKQTCDVDDSNANASLFPSISHASDIVVEPM